MIDISTLIKDAALDVLSLTGFLYNTSTTNMACSTVMTVMDSLVEKFQLACDKADGFTVCPGYLRILIFSLC